MIAIILEEHTKEVQKLVDSGRCTPQSLESSRQRLIAISDVIGKFDALSSWINGIIYSLNVAVILFKLYSMVAFDVFLTNTNWICGVAIWLWASFAYLGIPTIKAALIHARVSTIFDILTLNYVYFVHNSSYVPQYYPYMFVTG